MKFILMMSLCLTVCQAETANEAWAKLCGNSAGEPEFTWVVNDPALPNVLIYGDSISIQYHEELRDELKGEVNLYRIFTNGGDSGTVIENLTAMKETMRAPEIAGAWEFQWDVIQLNVGLHDLKWWKNGEMDRKNGAQVNGLKDYEKNLEKIFPFLENFAPDAVLVFATTTPVPEDSAGRDAGDAEKYNAAAREVLKNFPAVRVNDLFALTKPHQKNWWTRPGNVHFNFVGQKAQAKQTAEVIREALAAGKEK